MLRLKLVIANWVTGRGRALIGLTPVSTVLRFQFLAMFWIAPVFATEPLVINAYSSDLEFGVIANEDGICRMNDRGSLLGLSGQSCLGSGSRAVFDIRGESGRVVYITAAGSSSSGVTFTPKISGSASKVISSSGSTLLVLSGDLQLSNAVGGQHSLDFIVCVHYE